MCGSVSHYKITLNDGVKEPVRLCTKYAARMPEEHYPTFKREFEKEIQLFKAATTTTKLVITDAHKSISGYLKDNPLFHNHPLDYKSTLQEPGFIKFHMLTIVFCCLYSDKIFR